MEVILHIIILILCWGMSIRNNDTTPVTSLSLTNSTSLTAHMILYVLWHIRPLLGNDC
jgi:hypothetical protein